MAIGYFKICYFKTYSRLATADLSRTNIGLRYELHKSRDYDSVPRRQVNSAVSLGIRTHNNL